nr:MAG TPA: hypothetical protein [Caudoviricetes sp.]
MRIQSFSVILISRKGLSILSYKFEFNGGIIMCGMTTDL